MHPLIDYFEDKMRVINKSSDLQSLLYQEKKNNKQIGFVPTMGALHEGHLKLIKRAKDENNICVVSIFVNPTQFNNSEDLEKYPRTLQKDLDLLEPLGVDYVFTPTVEDIYPEPDTRIFDFGLLDKVMEGRHRPGHFNGVAQVVSKLFDIVQPNKAYFGEKDFQQLAIIKSLAEKLNYPIEIIPVEIIRESSGLAMSSRNQRLSEEQKKVVPIIYEILQEAKKLYQKGAPPKGVVEFVTNTINGQTDLAVEYFEIVDGCNLSSLDNWESTDYIVGCIAVYCGNIRLIDNIIFKKNTPENANRSN